LVNILISAFLYNILQMLMTTKTINEAVDKIFYTL